MDIGKAVLVLGILTLLFAGFWAWNHWKFQQDEATRRHEEAKIQEANEAQARREEIARQLALDVTWGHT